MPLKAKQYKALTTAVCVLFPFRTFRLRLRRSADAFSQNFMVVSENGAMSADLSHIYSGILEGGYDKKKKKSKENLNDFTDIKVINRIVKPEIYNHCGLDKTCG